MTTALKRTTLSLQLKHPDRAAYIEELLWTLDNVESITYRLDGAEDFKGFEVIGSSHTLAQAVEALIWDHELSHELCLKASGFIEEADWAESWKQFWSVNHILPNLVIQPSWEDVDPLPGDIVLKLDPGSAFGTGTHETTQLMLLLLSELDRVSPMSSVKLLDVGTGSGILAIYGAKLGCLEVLALDNDPLAVGVAEENMNRNGVSKRVLCSTRTLPEMPQGYYTVVVANILAPVLSEMMADLKRTMVPGGCLLLSGIVRKQFDEMDRAIGEHGLVLSRVLQKGDWIALVCQKPR